MFKRIIKKYHIPILGILLFSVPFSLNCSDAGGWDLTNNQNGLSTLTSNFPVITSSTLAADNSSITIQFSEGVYSDQGGSGLLINSDFLLSLDDKGTGITVTIGIVDHTAGGTTAILPLNITGSPLGTETVEIVPSNGLSIYDIDDNAMDSSQTTGVITLNAAIVPTVQFKISNSSGSESVTSVDVEVILSSPIGSNVIVDFLVTPQSAKEGIGNDFLLNSGQVTITNGNTSGYITFTVINDLINEQPTNEKFQIELTGVASSNADLGATTIFSYTIIDDD